MSRNSPEIKFKYLLPLIFLSFFIVPCYANEFQAGDTIKSNAPDKAGELTKDTSQLQKKDTLKIQSKDSLTLNSKDSATAKSDIAATKQLPDSVIYKKTTFTAEELIRGERLFYGLVYLGDKSVSCSACHNTAVSDTLNWNPDALEISIKYHDKNAYDLSKVLLRPTGKKMKLVHKDFQLTAEDIVLIKAYMNKFETIGLKQNKPVITNLLLLIIAFILFLVASTDLIIKKVFKNRKINWIIISVTGIFITWILAVNAIAFGRSKGYAPAQPVKFSHAVHAGQNKTDCNYCHYTAKVSKTAGIPPGSVCLNCHFLVRNGTRSGTAEIAKVLAAIDQNKPVQWVRIYRLPDFVFFSHEQHVSAGGINCEACHGIVKEMDRLYQVPDLSMGWCVDCHKTRKVNLSNEYYKTYYPEFAEAFKAGKIDSVMIANIGGKDCGKCHY